MKNACCRVALLFFMTLTASGLLFAQSDLGKISGFIKDPSGGTIANAKVTVRTTRRSNARQRRMNPAIVITNVPPGGTQWWPRPRLPEIRDTKNKLDPSADLVIDATLTLGAATQTVEVSASTVQLQTESASVQKLVTREQIDSLELNDATRFGLPLCSGARGTTLANLNFGFTRACKFYGSRNPENLITFDGAPATRTRSNGTSLEPQTLTPRRRCRSLPPTMLRIRSDFRRADSLYTKTARSQFHGAMYEYLRNTALNANTWARNANTNGLTSSAAPVHYNQFGVQYRGPHLHSRQIQHQQEQGFLLLGAGMAEV